MVLSLSNWRMLLVSVAGCLDDCHRVRGAGVSPKQFHDALQQTRFADAVWASNDDNIGEVGDPEPGDWRSVVHGDAGESHG